MKKPTYITNGYELVVEDHTGYSGHIIGNILELRHNNTVVDTVTLSDHNPTVYNTTA